MRNLIKNISLLSILTSCIATFSALAQPALIRVSYNDTHSLHEPMVKHLQALVEKRFNNKVKIKLYPYSKTYNETQALKELQQGNLDIAIPSLSELSNYSQRFKIFDLPFLFYSQSAAERFLNGEYGVRLSNSLYSKGFVGLGFLNNGMKQLAANKKILHPYDAVGLKIGVLNSSEVLIQQYEQMGSRSIVIKPGRINESLKKEALNGYENNWLNINKNKSQSMPPFIMESNHGYLGYLVVVSKQFWGIQSESTQNELRIVVKEAINYANRIVNQKMEKSRQSILDSGESEVYRLTAEERQAWAESLQIVWEIFEDDIGTELIKIAASER